MCGITGLLEFDAKLGAEFLGTTVGRMTETLHHRGPDDGDVWVDGPAGVALGHRRLSIIDLSSEGRQPMTSACERYVTTFNGEIYNFPALRKELSSLGHSFRGGSDTEVMLAAFTAWGVESALPRLNGMFAFAVWDRRDHTLTLARDRLGEKPLYYGRAGGSFVFASELKAIRAVPGFDAEIDRDAVAMLLRNRYVPSPWSIYRGIRKLSPGCFLTIRPGETDPVPRPYWSAVRAAERGLADPLPGDERDAVEMLDGLLRDAVGMRMTADVPLGGFLSGGVDSSLVVATMQALSSVPVRTFTVGLAEAGYDESTEARAVARHLGTEHSELIVTPREAMEIIPNLPTLYDEPFCDSSQIPTFLIAEFARRHVTVALSGDGGDELFGGYNRHAWLSSVWRRVGWMPQSLRRACGNTLRRVPPGAWDRMFLGAGRALPRRMRVRMPGDKIHKLAGVLSVSDADEAYGFLMSHWPDPASVVLGAREHERDDPAGSMSGVALRMMLTDAVTYLPDDILTKVDRASMGVSLEVRVPLLDHRVYEFAWRVPSSMKLRDGRGKWLLRRVLERYVPREMIDRPKMGFGIPLHDWLRGPLRDWAESLLDPARLRREAFFDPAPVRAAWDDHLSGRRNLQPALWSVLMFQSWVESTARRETVNA